MAWIYLIIAGLFECGWAIGLKYTEGFTRLAPSPKTVARDEIRVARKGKCYCLNIGSQINYSLFMRIPTSQATRCYRKIYSRLKPLLVSLSIC